MVPERRADLVLLEPSTPPLLRYRIFTEGLPLYEAEADTFERELLRAWHLYLETRRLREYEREYLARRAKEAGA